jgi:site-specific recombinase XerD
LPGGEGASKCGIGRQLAKLFGDYFEQHRRRVRGQGYGCVLTHRAQMVTRRHLTWLEQHGHLPSGTAAPEGSALGAARTTYHPQAVLQRLMAKVDQRLPPQLRQPLLDYLEYLVDDRQLVESSIESILRTNLALCRHLAEAGHDRYCQLRAAQLDQVVASLVTASHDTSGLLRRRQQVQTKHGHLRGFLRYLQRTGVLGRDLARVLISPPCYRASKPATVLSEQQVRSLLGSVDRTQAQGRRCYAILVLMTTYGLRPVDVAGLSLEQIHWRQRQLALVQRKTGCVLTLPLLAEVVAALWDYLRQDRLPGLGHRRVFVSLSWPPRPMRSETVCTVVAEALHQAGLGFASAKHLRATVATHLLRQGEALSTIQEVLGHRTHETTQRYAVTDVELLRQVLEESER